MTSKSNNKTYHGNLKKSSYSAIFKKRKTQICPSTPVHFTNWKMIIFFEKDSEIWFFIVLHVIKVCCFSFLITKINNFIKQTTYFSSRFIVMFLIRKCTVSICDCKNVWIFQLWDRIWLRKWSTGFHLNTKPIFCHENQNSRTVMLISKALWHFFRDRL